MPCEDAAAVGIWDLAGGSGNGAGPVLRLQQARPKETPEHGMAMALDLFSHSSGVRRAGSQPSVDAVRAAAQASRRRCSVVLVDSPVLQEVFGSNCPPLP